METERREWHREGDHLKKEQALSMVAQLSSQQRGMGGPSQAQGQTGLPSEWQSIVGCCISYFLLLHRTSWPKATYGGVYFGLWLHRESP